MGWASGLLHLLLFASAAVGVFEATAASDDAEPLQAKTTADRLEAQSVAALARGLHLLEPNLVSFSGNETSRAIARMLAVRESGSVNITSTPNPLGGSSLFVVNGTFHAIVGMILLAIFCGGAMDLAKSPAETEKGRPGMWLIGMIAASYVLLIPGILSVLVSYNVFVELHFKVIFIPFDVAYNMTEEAMTESMASLIHLLFSTGGWLGAMLVITYAIILPVVKIGLLIVAEHWRHSNNARRRSIARQSIMFVQVVSKWASPDMFAYILLLFLLRNLGHPPEVQSKAALDIGFLCFSIFCVCSTLSSLAIEPPEALVDTPQKPPKWLTALSRDSVVRFSYGLALLFCIFLGLGLFVPCMALRLSSDSLLEPNGPVPVSMRHFLMSLNLDDKVKAEVKLWDCVNALMEWAVAGEATCCVAFFMLSAFVLGCSILDVLALMHATSTLRDEDIIAATATMRRTGARERGHGGDAEELPCSMRVAWVLNHVAMLDVFCMGVIVVCLAGAAYKKMGIVLELRHGIIYLISAEVAHFAMYRLVKSALEHSAVFDQDDVAMDRGETLDADRRKLLAVDEAQE